MGRDNGNRSMHPKLHGRPNVLELVFRLTGAGTSAPVDKDAGELGSEIASISRTSMGLYVITPRSKFQGAIMSVDIAHVGTLDGARFKLTALDLATPSMTLRVTKPGAAKVPAWETIAVAGHTSGALPVAGMITAVELVAGGVTGAGNLRDSAAANSRDVRVVYDAAGIPTLSFLAGDAVTSAKYQQVKQAEEVVDIEAADSVYITLNVRTQTRN